MGQNKYDYSVYYVVLESKNLENRAYIAATKIMISAKSKDNLFELSIVIIRKW